MVHRATAKAAELTAAQLREGFGIPVLFAMSRSDLGRMNQAIADLRATTLAISVEYADVQINLLQHHGDPFDRLIVAQALTEKMAIISNDAA